MNAPLAYMAGQWVPAADLSISIFDAGFVLGATVTEQLRTFGGRIFRLQDHLDRFQRSLEIASIDPGRSLDEIAMIAERVVETNHPLLSAGDDLGLGIFATPGPYRNIVGAGEGQPMLCVYSFPLRFGQWDAKYETGQDVVISDVRQISPETLPPEIKCRSRMHYYLADLHAAQSSPGARAILLDQQGAVAEASTANVILYREEEGLVSPPEAEILPGISMMVVRELAESLLIPFSRRRIVSADLVGADEAFLTSTSNCLLPIVRCDGRPLGKGAPGEVYRKLLAAWSKSVGVDIAGQAQRFADRR